MNFHMVPLGMLEYVIVLKGFVMSLLVSSLFKSTKPGGGGGKMLEARIILSIGFYHILSWVAYPD